MKWPGGRGAVPDPRPDLDHDDGGDGQTLAMEPRILAIADELADGLFAQGIPADLVERYARQLPLAAICELLGLPIADRAKFTAWAAGFTRFTGTIR
jgi:cytochrome P450